VYDELFAAWRFEVENDELGSLSPDFYARVADYVRRIKEESRMLDKKAVKAGLLEREMAHVQRMVGELVWARYRKLVSLLTDSQKMPSNLLAAEEAALCTGFLSFVEAYQRFAKKLLQGQVSEIAVAKPRKPHKRVALRFLKAIPAVVGVDMKTYGPFSAEDVGSVPVENAKILVKRGLAEAVEVS
jgi:DNA replication initiation complex subunit (GINS family)